jgi:excisionase family DNA binding protein
MNDQRRKEAAMRIGEAAEALGISRDTIRRLERTGVIAPARDRAGQRRFSARDIERIRAAFLRSCSQEEAPLVEHAAGSPEK